MALNCGILCAVCKTQKGNVNMKHIKKIALAFVVMAGLVTVAAERVDFSQASYPRVSLTVNRCAETSVECFCTVIWLTQIMV